MEKERRGRGRPRKAAIEGERNSLGLRVTADVKMKLEDAATDSGRSQSQEAEFRLEQSFLDEHTRYDEFGGVENYSVEKLLFGVVTFIEAETGHSWRQDGLTFKQVAGAWGAILEILRGQASKSPGGAFDVGAAIAGQKQAIALMHRRIEDLVLHPPQPSWSDALVKALMGHEPPSTETGKKKRSRRRTD